ncbi:MAG: LysR family transcriptional regulator [Coriobacteriales bacterium]
MRIQTLYEFLVLSEKLNFTETAKGFFISQSVLSDHITKLEKELSTKLFIRDKHSVRLTEEGLIFKEDASKIVADYETALERLDLYKEGISSILRIGFLMGSYGTFLPPLCERYRQKHPEVEFRFRTPELGEMQNCLMNDEIDIALTIFAKGFEGDQFSHDILYSDSYKLAVPKGHRLASRKSVKIEDLKTEHVIASRFNQVKSMQAQISVMLRNAGVDVSVMEDVSDVGALMATLVATNSVAMALDHLRVFGGGNIIFIPIEDLDTRLFAGPVWKTSRSSGRLLDFVAFLQHETSGFTKEDFITRAI